MVYIPKSKTQKKYANEGEIIYKVSGKPFSGNYIQVPDGKIFAGHSNINLGPELEFQKRNLHPNQGVNGKRISVIGRVSKYNILKENVKKYIINTKTPSNSKPIPSPEDYIKGYFRRYFIKKINQKHYTEVNRGVYDSLQNKLGTYDHNLYESGYIKWYLRGDVHKNNSLSIKFSQKRFPNLITIFPILNEYQIHDPKSKIQEHLTTGGGELYFMNGTEYIGEYHIHPFHGPMEGSTHTDDTHSRLYYTNQLPSIDNTDYTDFIDEYNKIICYRCKSINGNQNIVSFKEYYNIGCPSNSFVTRQEAINNCDRSY